MKKQMIFALFAGICVLTQHGSKDDLTNTNVNNLPYQQSNMLYIENNPSIETISFLANDPLQKNNVPIQTIRNIDGSLRMKQSLLSKVKKVNNEMIKQKEEYKKLQTYRQIASNAGIDMDEKGRFALKTTTYGMDCIGCSFIDGQAKTALGVSLDVNKGVQLPDASWQSGIRYGKYYIIAADKNIPLCSIIKVSNHGLSGSGLTPNTPFYAIVLDRGGGIYGNHIDLYIGLEDSKAIQKVENKIPVAEFKRVGGQQGNTCSIEDIK